MCLGPACKLSTAIKTFLSPKGFLRMEHLGKLYIKITLARPRAFPQKAVMLPVPANSTGLTQGTGESPEHPPSMGRQLVILSSNFTFQASGCGLASRGVLFGPHNSSKILNLLPTF